jgi:hypothetical protein
MKKQPNFTEFAATAFGNMDLKPSQFHVFQFPVKNFPSYSCARLMKVA